MRRLLIFLLLLILPACQFGPLPPVYPIWQYSDLRIFDSPGDAIPSQDIIAAYTRLADEEFQIRLDFLDLETLPTADLYIALDIQPGGQNSLPSGVSTRVEWDILLIFPASGQLHAMVSAPPFETRPRAMPVSGLRIIRNPMMDYVTLSIRQEAIGLPGGAWQVEVFVVSEEGDVPVDTLGPFSAFADSPPQARVLFAFWNTLPAYTPVQALRRWDGAHTGPLGGRHGLHNLLRAARNYAVPLVLLDLNNPASLSALDFLESGTLVQEMVASGTLILPVALPALSPAEFPVPAWALERIATENREICSRFGLPSSPFLYDPGGGLLASMNGWSSRPFQALFLREKAGEEIHRSENGVRSPARWRNLTTISIPPQESDQAGEDGPSLGVRRQLMEAALLADSGNSGSYLALGGDLPVSTWGIPQYTRSALAWIKAHPWIQVLTAQDIAGLPAGQKGFEPPLDEIDSSSAWVTSLETALQSAPESSLAQAAWETYRSLVSPQWPEAEQLSQLRSQYLGQVGSLLLAADWESCFQGVSISGEVCRALPASTCALDPDRDGEMECLLASERVFALFEPDGVLSWAFARIGEGGQAQVHQVIGPSSQLATGLGDSSGWNLSDPHQADPQVSRGAFLSKNITGGYQESIFIANIQNEELIFSAQGALDPGSVLERRYRLAEDGILAQVRFIPGAPPGIVEVYFSLDPTLRFRPNWRRSYQFEQMDAQRWLLSTRPGVSGAGYEGFQVIISANQPLTLDSFRDSRRYLTIPENPDLEMPAGHYLAFPLARFEIASQGDLAIQIHFRK